MARYEITVTGVRDTVTHQQIPDSPGNRHWQEYQRWLAQGNTPDPQPAPPPAPTIDQEYDGQSEWVKAVAQLAGLAPAAIKAQVLANRP